MNPGERRGVSPTWKRRISVEVYTSGLRLDARQWKVE